MKKRFLLSMLVLIGLLLTGCSGGADETRVTVQGTIEGFIAAVAAGDFEKADGYFIREELMENFRPDLLYSQYSTSMRAEGLVELFDADLFSYAMAWPHYSGALDPSLIKSGPYRDITRALLSTYDYSSLKALDIGQPLQATQQDYFKMYAARAAIYGADDVTERIVLTEYQGGTYLTGYVLVRYNKEWGIFGLAAPAADMLGKAPVYPITQTEYMQFYIE